MMLSYRTSRFYPIRSETFIELRIHAFKRIVCIGRIIDQGRIFWVVYLRLGMLGNMVLSLCILVFSHLSFREGRACWYASPFVNAYQLRALLCFTHELTVYVIKNGFISRLIN